MAPRTARILIDESLAPPSASNPPTVRSKLSRRLSGAAEASTLKASTRSNGKGQEYLIRFTDVIIRAQKTGETEYVHTAMLPRLGKQKLTRHACRSIPGSFSRGKEKKGKQGKTRKAGKVRNTCTSSCLAVERNRAQRSLMQTALSASSDGSRARWRMQRCTT